MFTIQDVVPHPGILSLENSNEEMHFCNMHCISPKMDLTSTIKYRLLSYLSSLHHLVLLPELLHYVVRAVVWYFRDLFFSLENIPNEVQHFLNFTAKTLVYL